MIHCVFSLLNSVYRRITNPLHEVNFKSLCNSVNITMLINIVMFLKSVFSILTMLDNSSGFQEMVLDAESGLDLLLNIKSLWGIGNVLVRYVRDVVDGVRRDGVRIYEEWRAFERDAERAMLDFESGQDEQSESSKSSVKSKKRSS